VSQINTTTITANLTKDPEFRQVTEKFAVARLRVAASRRAYNSQTSQYEDKPVWLSVEVVGGQAKIVSERLAKGSRVAITGELDYQEWNAQDGSKRSEVRVIVDSREGGRVVFLDKKGEGPAQAQVNGAPAAAPAAFPPAPPAAPAPQAAPAPVPQAPPAAPAPVAQAAPPAQQAFVPPAAPPAPAAAGVAGSDDIPF
jgi:single stranded DNA-binding protein